MSAGYVKSGEAEPAAAGRSRGSGFRSDASTARTGLTASGGRVQACTGWWLLLRTLDATKGIYDHVQRPFKSNGAVGEVSTSTQEIPQG